MRDPDDLLQGMDDCLSVMSAESYFESRVTKLISKYARDSPTLSWEHSCSNVSLLVCGFAASVLGAFHNSSWIPVVLGLAAFLTTIKNYRACDTQLLATNKALSGLHSLEVQYKGMSNMDRRTPSFKRTLFLKTEQLAFEVTKSWVGSVSVSFEGQEEEHAEEKAKGAKSSRVSS